MTSAEEDVTRLTKQNAMLMRALLRVKAERDALARQLAALQLEAVPEVAREAARSR